MYNISSHYQLIFESLKNVTKHRRMLYLFPYGSTDPNNLEEITDNVADQGDVINEGPMFIFYDQEPIYDSFNYILFDYINQNFQPPFILVTTEKDSEPVKKIQEKYNWPVIDYFHHIFAASDWFRSYKFHEGILPVRARSIQKKFITFNRITGNSRVYRSIFISELAKRNLLHLGNISYSKICPVHGNYKENLLHAASNQLIDLSYAHETIKVLDNLDHELRIDFKEEEFIQNDSMTLGPINALMESFVYVVTETCFWEKKKHLTEKIFKPIVSKQPFILLGCANNLEYLRDYGFKTFNKWWDESYDKIEDPILRLNAVVDIVEQICKLSNDDITSLLVEMENVLNYNYRLFFSEKFIEYEWSELRNKFRRVLHDKILFNINS